MSNGTDMHGGWEPSLVHFMLNLDLTGSDFGLFGAVGWWEGCSTFCVYQSAPLAMAGVEITFQ